MSRSDLQASREFVKSHLQRERWLTAKHLAVLKGRQAQFLALSGNFPGYSGMTRLLNRMVEDGEIVKTVLKKGNRIFVNLPQIFHLPTVTAPNLHNWAHELHAADVYVALECSGVLRHWLYGPFDEMPDTLVPDRAAVFETAVPIFWEIDEDTEGMPEIVSKVERYQAFAKSSGRKFYVVFSALTSERAKRIYVDALYRFKGGQFLATHKDRLIADPTGPVLASPKDYSRGFSLLELV